MYIPGSKGANERREGKERGKKKKRKEKKEQKKILPLMFNSFPCFGENYNIGNRRRQRRRGGGKAKKKNALLTTLSFCTSLESLFPFPRGGGEKEEGGENPKQGERKKRKEGGNGWS